MQKEKQGCPTETDAPKNQAETVLPEEEAGAALYEKMAAEQADYKAWLLKQKPEEILNHTFEYTVREDILSVAENGVLTGEQARALLQSESPLADVYKDFQKLETEYMDTLRECLGLRADKEIQQAKERAGRSSPDNPYSDRPAGEPRGRAADAGARKPSVRQMLHEKPDAPTAQKPPDSHRGKNPVR